MKRQTKEAGEQAAAEQTVESVNSAIELSQKAANVMLENAVKTAEMTDNYLRNVIQIGLDAQENSPKVARNYFDSMAEINREWLNLLAASGEKTIDSIGENARKPFSDAFAASAATIENAAAQTKQAAK